MVYSGVVAKSVESVTDGDKADTKRSFERVLRQSPNDIVQGRNAKRVNGLKTNPTARNEDYFLSKWLRSNLAIWGRYKTEAKRGARARNKKDYCARRLIPASPKLSVL